MSDNAGTYRSMALRQSLDGDKDWGLILFDVADKFAKLERELAEVKSKLTVAEAERIVTCAAAYRERDKWREVAEELRQYSSTLDLDIHETKALKMVWEKFRKLKEASNG